MSVHDQLLAIADKYFGYTDPQYRDVTPGFLLDELPEVIEIAEMHQYLEARALLAEALEVGMNFPHTEVL